MAPAHSAAKQKMNTFILQNDMIQTAEKAAFYTLFNNLAWLLLILAVEMIKNDWFLVRNWLRFFPLIKIECSEINIENFAHVLCYLKCRRICRARNLVAEIPPGILTHIQNILFIGMHMKISESFHTSTRDFHKNISRFPNGKRIYYDEMTGDAAREIEYNIYYMWVCLCAVCTRNHR